MLCHPKDYYCEEMLLLDHRLLLLPCLHFVIFAIKEKVNLIWQGVGSA